MRLDKHCILCNNKDPVPEVVETAVDRDPSAAQDEDMPALNGAGALQL